MSMAERISRRLPVKGSDAFYEVTAALNAVLAKREELQQAFDEQRAEDPHAEFNRLFFIQIGTQRRDRTRSTWVSGVTRLETNGPPPQILPRPLPNLANHYHPMSREFQSWVVFAQSPNRAASRY